MKARLKAYWKRFKWVVIAACSVVVMVVVFVLRGLFSSRKLPKEEDEGPQLPPIDARIKEQVKQAEEEATVARIEARVRAQTDREQLERIAKVKDGAERRRRLAAMLRRL